MARTTYVLASLVSTIEYTSQCRCIYVQALETNCYYIGHGQTCTEVEKFMPLHDED